MLSTHTASTMLTTINCGTCGGVYAISERFRREKRDNGGYWNCPYCKCRWGFGESELDRVRKELKSETDCLTRERSRHDQTRADRDHKEAQRRAEKAAKTKIQRRVGAGVCPCCKRHFTNLERHMKTKHPNFGKK